MGKLYFILFLLLLIGQFTHAQIPINDAAWQIQTSKCEEFNSSLDFTTKWNTAPSVGVELWGAGLYLPTNLDQTSGTTLKIKADTLLTNVYYSPSTNHNPITGGVTYAYSSGYIQSQANAYKFGYLEISAKYPTGYYSAWPAFWLISSNCLSPIYYNEIDIAENGATESQNGYQIGTNTYLSAPSSCNGTVTNQQTIYNLPLLSAAEHKYAVKWEPNSITWYFDDVPVRTVQDVTGAQMPQNAMTVVLNFGVFTWNVFLPTDWNQFTHWGQAPQGFPQTFEINYLRYYTLVTDCNTNLTICVPGDYDRKVKKTIVTNTACTPTYNPSTEANSYTLRATDYILLDAGTDINPSSVGYFALEITGCPQ